MGKKFDDLVKDAVPFKEQAKFYEKRKAPKLKSKGEKAPGKRTKGELEDPIKKAILEYLRFRYPKGYFWIHYEGMRIVKGSVAAISPTKGQSDIQGVLHGTFVAIEVKVPGGTVTREQINFIDNVCRAGGVAFVATSIEDVKNVMEGHDIYGQ